MKIYQYDLVVVAGRPLVAPESRYGVTKAITELEDDMAHRVVLMAQCWDELSARLTEANERIAWIERAGWRVEAQDE